MSPGGSQKLPPEERLLKLIRGKEPQPAMPAVFTPSQNVGALKTESSVASQRTIRWSSLVIGLLSLMLIAEIGLVIVEALKPLPYIEVPVVPTSRQAGNAGVQKPPEVLTSIADSAVRPIFVAPVVVVRAVEKDDRPSIEVSSLSARLSLLGIVSGEPPQAIIEDSQTKKTHFVSEGQHVAEGARVKQVLENSVVLEVADETIELTL